MPPYKILYKQSQGRIMSLVNNQNAHLPVPACPGWTIRDLMAHLFGTMADVSKGKISEAVDDDWSATHIARAGTRSVGDLGAEWHLRATTSPAIFQSLGALLVAECVTHEFDIKGALANTQGRELQVVRTVALFYLNALDQAWRADSVPPLRFVTETSHLDIGGESPEATVDIGWWEIGRLVSGRRSIEQVADLPWSTDPAPWLDHLFVFGPRETPLTE